MEQKNKMHLMDMWLMMNTEDNPFEFFLGVDQGRLEASSRVDESVAEKSDFARASVAAFATFVGLQAAYTKSDEPLSAFDYSLRLRLLGDAIQNTHLAIEYGLSRRRDATVFETDDFDTQFHGTSLSLYLNRHLGLAGLYRVLHRAVSDRGNSLRGRQAEGSVFVDYRLIRIEGTYFQESFHYSDGLTLAREERRRQGLLIGLKVFF
jgi:hypothetical protein